MKINKLTLSILILFLISFVSASCIRVGDTFINNNGNFTINESTGYIYSIVDKATGQELIEPNKNLGMAYYVNNSIGWVANYNVPYTTHWNQVGNLTYSVNNSNQIILTQVHKYFNVTYQYDCYDNSFEIKTNVKKTISSSILNSGIFSSWQTRYMFPVNWSNFANWDMKIRPIDGATILYPTEKNFSINSYAQNIAETLGTSNSVHIYNESLKFFLQLKEPVSRVGVHGQGTYFNNDFDYDIPLQIYDGNVFFNNSDLSYTFSIVLGNTWEKSKEYAYNFTKNTIPKVQGSWLILGAYDNFADADLRNYYNNGVRFVQIHAWMPYYGYYPTQGNWKDYYGTVTLNVTYINWIADRIKSYGMYSYLYFNPIELQYANATQDYPNDIFLNITQGYTRAIWDDEIYPQGQTYLMDMYKTQYFINITNMFENVVNNYTSYDGFFIDRLDYLENNYNSSNNPTWTTNALYNFTISSSQQGIRDFAINSSNYVHSKGKEIIFNCARDPNVMQYADFLSCDTTYPSIMRARLSYPNKMFFQLIDSPSDYNANVSILFGVYPSYNSFSTNKLKYIYMINKSANQEMLDWENDTYVKYPNLFGVRVNRNLIHSSNSDWYDMFNHKLVNTSATSYSYIQSTPYANLIAYNFTLDKGYYTSDGISIKDTNSNEIDKVYWNDKLQDINSNYVQIGSGSNFSTITLSSSGGITIQ